MLRPYVAIAISRPTCGGVWRSLVAHLVRDEGVAGSNPATPTNSQVNPPKQARRSGKQ